jgi:hypothetical protein
VLTSDSENEEDVVSAVLPIPVEEVIPDEDGEEEISVPEDGQNK